MSKVFEVKDGEVHIIGENPITTKMFKNLDAALDYCRFAEPESMHIERLYNGGMGQVTEVIGYRLQCVGSKGII